MLYPGLLCACLAQLQSCLTTLLAGPIQYDAAVDPVIARQKIKGDSEVAGRANVLIFPDLNTGNNTYKVCPEGSDLVVGEMNGQLSATTCYFHQVLGKLLPAPICCRTPDPMS